MERCGGLKAVRNVTGTYSSKKIPVAGTSDACSAVTTMTSVVLSRSMRGHRVRGKSMLKLRRPMPIDMEPAAPGDVDLYN